MVEQLTRNVRVVPRRRLARAVRSAAALLLGVLVAASCSSAPGSSAAGSSAPGSSAPGGGAAGTSPHAGSPHGTSTGPAGGSAQPLRAGERFVTLTLPRPYTPRAPNGGTDEYRCFLIDPHLTAPAFLTGTQFLPQNAAVVHHAIVFRIAPGAATAARAVDARTPGDGWTCFGNDGLDDESSWVGAWAPGATENLLTSDVGYPMPAGSMIVLQVHYNLLATGGQPAGSDRSGVRLRLTGATGLAPLRTLLLPAPVELPCGPGEAGPLCDRAAAVADVTRRFGEQVGGTEAALLQECSPGGAVVPGDTQHCDRAMRAPVTVYAAAGHMHLLGRSIRIELNPGRPTARTLLDLPVYNFDDQRTRPLDTPVAVRAGDTIRVTCTHDAGLRRQIPALRGLPPRYVVWGDGTSDEMCLGLLVVTPKA